MRRAVTVGDPLTPANVSSSCSVTVPSLGPPPGTMLNVAGNVKSRVDPVRGQSYASGCVEAEPPRDTSAIIDTTRPGASVSTTTITNVAGV